MQLCTCTCNPPFSIFIFSILKILFSIAILVEFESSELNLTCNLYHTFSQGWVSPKTSLCAQGISCHGKCRSKWQPESVLFHPWSHTGVKWKTHNIWKGNQQYLTEALKINNRHTICACVMAKLKIIFSICSWIIFLGLVKLTFGLVDVG